jgi:PAS domain S-box-containing protein
MSSVEISTDHNEIDIGSLSLQRVFLLFCSAVAVIVLAILFFIAIEAFRAYEDSFHLRSTTKLAIDSRAINYGLAEESVASTKYLAALDAENQDELEIKSRKEDWFILHQKNIQNLARFKLEVNKIVKGDRKAVILKQILQVENILIDLSKVIRANESLDQDTLLEEYIQIFNVLDIVRVEILSPQNAGQFVMRQSLLVGRAVQDLYDLTVSEATLLTRIIYDKDHINDGNVMARLTNWRDEATKNREYLRLYISTTFQNENFTKGSEFNDLENAIKAMEGSFSALDTLRRKLYAASMLGTNHRISLDEWNQILTKTLDDIKNVEKLVVVPAQIAVQENVHYKVQQIALIFLSSLFIFGNVAILFYFLKNNVLSPIENVTGSMTSLAAGELNVDLPKVPRKDEIWHMVEALAVFKDTALEARRLASFPQKNPDPIIELNENGFITYINPAAKMTFPDISVDAMSHPLFKDFVDLQVESLKESGTSTHEVNVGDKYYERYTTFINLQGKALIRVFIRDITERIEKEKALKETQEKAQVLLGALDTSNTAILMVDLTKDDWTISYLNDSFSNLTGYKSREILDKAHDSWINSKKQSHVLKKLNKAIKSESSSQEEFQIMNKSGDLFWARIRGTPVFAEHEHPVAYILIMNDITDDKLKAELERKQQNMMSIAKMAGGMAHEINNALQPILGLSETLLKKFKEDEAYASDTEMAKVIYDYADYARNIVSDMLAFTKQDAREDVEFDAISILKEVMVFAQDTAPETVKFEFSGVGFDVEQEGDLIIKADKTGLIQIFTNLVKNACHAMNDKGTIRVNVDKVKIDSYTADNVVLGEHIKIALSDTGSGMNKETLEKVFEPFFSTKEIGKGTGLGLSVIYGIIKNWNGEIYVESEEGKGTTFFIYLPLVQ